MKKQSKIIAIGCLATLIASTGFVSASEDDQQDDSGPIFGLSSECGWGSGIGRGAAMRFQAIDQNGDGAINDDEAAANAEMVFAVMDKDDSGEITEAEFMSVRMGRGFRRNKARQAAMQKRKKERFPQMDNDKNQVVSQVEFLTAAQKRFAATDHNGDGKVTPWEFRASRRMF